jgi:hypothetical protein
MGSLSVRIFFGVKQGASLSRSVNLLFRFRRVAQGYLFQVFNIIICFNCCPEISRICPWVSSLSTICWHNGDRQYLVCSLLLHSNVALVVSYHCFLEREARVLLFGVHMKSRHFSYIVGNHKKGFISRYRSHSRISSSCSLFGESRGQLDCADFDINLFRHYRRRQLASRRATTPDEKKTGENART